MITAFRSAPDLPVSLIAPRFRRHGDAMVSRNERQMLAAVWRAPDQTRASLTAQMDITQQSVHRLLSTLHDDGLILFGPLVPPKYKGKPSPRLLLNPRYGCALGVSLDTDRVGATCMDFSGSYVTRDFAIAGDPVAVVLDRLDAMFSLLLEQTGFRREEVLGIGFTISGYLMKNGRYNPPDPLAHWSEVELARSVSERFGLPCWTENTANSGAIAEAMFGLGRRYRDFAYLSFNYGFGAGLVCNGELLRGAFGNAGEIGMVFTPEEGHRRPALGLLLGHLRARGQDLRTIDDIEALLTPLHPAVAEWIDLVAPQMNRAVNALAAVADPGCIVFGGQVPPVLARRFIDGVAFFARPRHGHINPLPDLAVSQIGRGAPSIGAACLPLRELAF